MVKNTFIYEFFLFFVCIAIALIIALNSIFSFAVIDGVNLFIACIFPSLFPYLFITAILSELKITKKAFSLFSPLTSRLFNCPGIVGYAYFISLISGYPLGTKTVCDLKTDGLLTENQSVRALALCSTSSPVFLIGSVGSLMFNNSSFGIILLIVHIISSLLVGFIFSFYHKREDKGACFSKIQVAETPQKSTDDFFSRTIENSISSVLFVGGIITLFYLLTEILCYFKILSPLTFALNSITNNPQVAEGLAFSLFECTKGLKVIASQGVSFLSLPIVSLICGFGGISVIMQSIPFIKKAKIKIAWFLVSKTLQAIISFFVGLIFSLFLF